MTDAQPATTPPHEQPAIRVTAMPADANFNGDIFGGWIMSWMDLAAGNTASRRSQGRAVTVAIDAVSFHHPVHIGDELSVWAKVTSVGRTSMKIAVEAWQRARDGDSTSKVTSATFTFVAIDLQGRPRPVPPDSTP
ncbi:MAG: thioesterase superfamily protein [Alphaproteobacteria bacterium]|nr:thioesterase superfamily protein [Alphaproteobacteria bacterium]MDB5741092.1 thioesterase superfamily protein [Alphaproteobacteria bacterium]